MRRRNRGSRQRPLRPSELARLRQLEGELARERKYQFWVWVTWILATLAGLLVGTTSGIWWRK